ASAPLGAKISTFKVPCSKATANGSPSGVGSRRSHPANSPWNPPADALTSTRPPPSPPARPPRHAIFYNDRRSLRLNEGLPMSDTYSFERLEGAVAFIAQHPDSPGKRDTVSECLADIEGRFGRGALTLEQKTRLLTLLLCPDARHAP